GKGPRPVAQTGVTLPLTAGRDAAVGNSARRCGVELRETEPIPPAFWRRKVEFPRVHREPGDAFGVKDPEPVESAEDIWTPAAQVATVGIFVLLLGVCLFFCRPLLLPVAAALVIGTTLAPIVKGAARHRISPWATAVVLGGAL